MTHTKIFTRPDGVKVELIVRLWFSSYDDTPKWELRVSTCQPKKRTWYSTYSGDDYLYRRLDLQGRQAFILESQLKYVTKEEILEAKKELIAKIPLD